MFKLINCLIVLLIGLSLPAATYGQQVRKLTFDGVLSEQKLSIEDLGLPADWSDYSHLIMDVRTSTPQRFSLWLYRVNGTPVRLMLQPFGQNTWFRASIPLQYFKGMDRSGNDLASSINRRTNSFWMSVWGPFGDINAINALGFAMTYPINKPIVEIRSIHLSKEDEGSEFLEKLPVLTEFNQWANADWPSKIKSRAQLDKELADEEKTFGSNADFDYCDMGGYKNTNVKATGFFRVDQLNGKWWFVDPHGHLFLSTGANGTSTAQRSTTPAPDQTRIKRRLESWGMTTGGEGRVNTIMLRWQNNPGTTFLGLPDVYADDFAKNIDDAADKQCTPLKADRMILGYFIGNEPPWDGREATVADMILAGPPTATQAKMKAFIADRDTPARRKYFIIAAF